MTTIYSDWHPTIINIDFKMLERYDYSRRHLPDGRILTLIFV